MNAHDLLSAGRVDDCLNELKAQVRDAPERADLRLFLAQVLAVRGEWEKARDQLQVASGLDPKYLFSDITFSPALRAEEERALVFSGKAAPLIFGAPDPWLGGLVQGNQFLAQGQASAGWDLIQHALEDAPATTGSINGKAFEWLADSDQRFGPTLEAVIDGKYYWVPLQRILEVDIREPSSFEEKLWVQARFRWTNNGEAQGLIPVRYPGSESAADPDLRLSRKTEWIESGEGCYLALGVRVFQTDRGEDISILDAREIRLQNSIEEGGPNAGA